MVDEDLRRILAVVTMVLVPDSRLATIDLNVPNYSADYFDRPFC